MSLFRPQTSNSNINLLTSHISTLNYQSIINIRHFPRRKDNIEYWANNLIDMLYILWKL
jgi:hypothetical protein